MHLRLLRLFLGFAGFAWGLSVVGVFLSWSDAAITYDRMLDYWLRMAAGAFALMGGWYFVLMISPQRFYAAIPWFGGLMLVEGVILLVHGLRLSLPPFPFYADTAACLIGGGAILFLSRSAKPGLGVMSTLAISFPLLASELSRGLRAAGRAPLADQVEAATIARVTFDDSANAGYIYVRPSRALSVVETNIVGVRHGEALEVRTRYWTTIDIDNFGRLAGIEILAPGDLKDELRTYAHAEPGGGRGRVGGV
jgi:uncharacterized protein YuzE